jgi:hypothetical protein
MSNQRKNVSFFVFLLPKKMYPDSTLQLIFVVLHLRCTHLYREVHRVVDEWSNHRCCTHLMINRYAYILYL